MEKRAVGWIVTEGVRLEVVLKFWRKFGSNRERQYYTGPEERLKYAADEGGPKVIWDESEMLRMRTRL
jgi:hypothetical protein